jgi:hypothetical protein
MGMSIQQRETWGGSYKALVDHVMFAAAQSITTYHRYVEDGVSLQNPISDVENNREILTVLRFEGIGDGR